VHAKSKRLIRSVRTRLTKKVILGTVGVGTVIVLAPSVWTYASSSHYRTDVAHVPATPVALVLGAGVWGSTPSPFLVGRLNIAVQLYQQGKVKVVLVSGDNSRKDYDEPAVMRDYLVEHGVPAQKIVVDDAGFDTWDSCVRAKKIFGVDRATVVSQDFHLPRAVALCRRAGIDAWGVGHDSSHIDEIRTDFGYAREVLATLKAMDDVLTESDPRFLGPKEAGVQQALAAQ
jgi:vancomycin permeability regulator SanA